jgi:hypothetical protein
MISFYSSTDVPFNIFLKIWKFLRGGIWMKLIFWFHLLFVFKCVFFVNFKASKVRACIYIILKFKILKSFLKLKLNNFLNTEILQKPIFGQLFSNIKKLFWNSWTFFENIISKNFRILDFLCDRYVFFSSSWYSVIFEKLSFERGALLRDRAKKCAFLKG